MRKKKKLILQDDNMIINEKRLNIISLPLKNSNITLYFIFLTHLHTYIFIINMRTKLL